MDEEDLEYELEQEEMMEREERERQERIRRELSENGGRADVQRAMMQELEQQSQASSQQPSRSTFSGVAADDLDRQGALAAPMHPPPPPPPPAPAAEVAVGVPIALANASSSQLNAAIHSVLAVPTGDGSSHGDATRSLVASDAASDVGFANSDRDMNSTSNGDVTPENLGRFLSSRDNPRAGYTLHPIPFDEASLPVDQIWASWGEDDNDRMRAVRHMVFNIPIDVLDPAPEFMSSFRKSSDPVKQQRIQAYEAVLGMLAIPCKGFFPYDSCCIQEEAWVDLDEEARAKKIKNLLPMPSYIFKHRFLHRVGESNMSQQWAPTHRPAEVPGESDRPDTNDEMDATTISTYHAPMFSFSTETLYAPGEDYDEFSNPNSVGVEVGLRVHLLVWNPRFATATLVNQAMDENLRLHRSFRASRTPEAARSHVAETASRKQRSLVGDPNAGPHAKYVSICDNTALIQNIVVISGGGDGTSRGRQRAFYSDMQSAFGRSGRDTKMDVCTDGTGSSHALSFEHLLNARRSDGLPMVAGLVDEDGVPIKLHPLQADPKSYYSPEDYRLRVPLGDNADFYTLTNNNMSLFDTGMPNNLHGEMAAGANVLEAFWATKRGEEDMTMCEDDILRNFAFCNQTLDPELRLDEFSTPAMISRVVKELRERGMLTQQLMNKPLQHMFASYMEKFKRSKRKTASERRLYYTSMMQPDALDVTPQDRAAAEARLVKDTTEGQLIRKVNLVTESTGHAISVVVKLVQRAREIKLRAIKEKRAYNQIQPAEEKRCNDEVAKWYADAMSETLGWSLRLMNRTMTDSQNESAIEPVSRSIWQNALKLFSEFPTESGVFAKVDPNHPRRNHGSANLAFIFNVRMESSKLSPHGNYFKFLKKVYSSVMGIKGRVMGARWAMHYASFTPMTTGTLREIVSINGVKGVAKSMTAGRFQTLFNLSHTPQRQRHWWTDSGQGSAAALKSGFMSPTSGGVEVTDEAIRSMTTSGNSDDAATREQMEDLKQVTSMGKTCRPRAEQNPNAHPESPDYWRTALHVMHHNTSRITLNNLGPNFCTKDGKENKGRTPDEAKAALIDRCNSWVMVEKEAQEQTMDDTQFRNYLESNAVVVNIHAAVSALTYMCLQFVKVVPEFQLQNLADAMMVFEHLDKQAHMEYDLPVPDARRREIRRQYLEMMAMESAVVTVMLYKETAVAYEHNLPISKPFDNNVDPKDAVHTLRPFSIEDLAPIIKRFAVDQEIIAKAWSFGLDRNLYCCPEMHWVLLTVARLHGCNDTDRGPYIKAKNDDVVAVGDNSQPNPQPCTQSNSQLSDRQTGDGSAPDPPAVDSMASARNQSSTSVGTHATDPSGLWGESPFSDSDNFRQFSLATNSGGGSSSDAPNQSNQSNQSSGSNGDSIVPEVREPGNGCSSSSTEILNMPSEIHGLSENEVFKRLSIIRTKRILTNEFSRRMADKGSSKNKRAGQETPTFSRLIEKEMHNVSIDGVVMDVERIKQLLLPSLGEVLDCGYSACDISSWIDGMQSQEFGKEDGELIFYGTKKKTEWSFERRIGFDNKPAAIDVCWRTLNRAGVAAATPAADPTQDGVSAAAATAAPSAPSAPQPWERAMWNDIAERVKRADGMSKFPMPTEQIFDRLAQIKQAEPHLGRLLVVGNAGNKRGITSIRKNFEGSNGTESRSTAEKYFQTVDVVRTDHSSVIPIDAAVWRGNDRSTDVAVARNPVESKGLYMGSGMGQQRLDKLLLQDALPAVLALTSSEVRRGCPIKDHNGQLYFNSGFLMGIVRFHLEVSATISVIPGLRHIGVKDKTVSQQGMVAVDRMVAEGTETNVAHHSGTNSSDNSSNGVSNTQFNRSALGNIMMRQSLEFQSTSICNGARVLSVTREQAEAELQELNAKNAEAHESEQTPASKPGSKEEDEEVDHENVQAVLEECKGSRLEGELLHTEMARRYIDISMWKEENVLFDCVPIFYSYRACAEFESENPALTREVMQRFPGVFSGFDELMAYIPEICSRFAPDGKSESKKCSEDTLVTFSVAPKRSTTQVQIRNKRKREFSISDLAAVKRAHYSATRKTVTDYNELVCLAPKYIDKQKVGRGDPLKRSQLFSNAIKDKLNSGLISVTSPLKFEQQDGCNLMARVRVRLAADSSNKLIDDCKISSVRKAAEYLRPVELGEKEQFGTGAQLELDYWAIFFSARKVSDLATNVNKEPVFATPSDAMEVDELGFESIEND